MSSKPVCAPMRSASGNSGRRGLWGEVVDLRERLRAQARDRGLGREVLDLGERSWTWARGRGLGREVPLNSW